MAGERVEVLVIGKGYVAVGTTRHPTTLVTFYYGRKASPVLEENDLLTIMQSLSYCHSKVRRQYSSHNLTMAEILYVYHVYLWQFDILVSLCKCDVAVFLLKSVVICLCTWRGCSEESLGTIHMCKDDGGRASVITRGWVLLLERAFVLLIDNYKP
jgi:hypothetical protein